MKYQVTMCYPDGDVECGELFDTMSEAESFAQYQISCYRTGGEVLHMSSPGDYPLSSDADNIDYSISEIEE
ncbi:hypothetical protein [Bifidobacterium simiarum]|nr:hypothetical protein [Bifidobacterium simiarum]